MRQNPDDVPPSINWPESITPTPAADREYTSKFSTNASKSRKHIQNELENHIEADQWYIDEVTGSYDYPGIVVHWSNDGTDYAIVADEYTSKKANLRAAYYWLHETRMREQRPVKTAQDSFAAAQLPSGDDDALAVPEEGHAFDPAAVLGVASDATQTEIRDAYREKIQEVHPDRGGSLGQFKRVKMAYERLLDDR